MKTLVLPELFYQISISLNDKEKIFLTSCSKVTYSFKSLIKLDSEYDLEINNKWHVKNILIKDFSLENKIKELTQNSIPESIEVNSKYVKFISDNTNIKLFYDEEIIGKIVLYECYYMAMKIMLNNNESIENINKQFIKASERGYLSIIKLLIELGADIHTGNDIAIVNASHGGNLPLVKLLIDFGANIHIQYNQIIVIASAQGHLSVVKLLIENGIDIHIDNDRAIVWASQQGHLSVVKLLIDSGANVHAQDNRSLILASGRGHLSVVKLLIDSGADVHAQDNRSLILASDRGHSLVVKSLVDSGADIHAQNNKALINVQKKQIF